MSFTPTPGDLFDVMALALLALRQSHPHRWQTTLPSGLVTGMPLRQELAHWLQTPAGRQCGGPRLPTGYEPPWQPAPQRVMASLPMAPHAFSAERILAEAEQTLRHGGWSLTLDHLVPTLMSRLPPTHRLRARGLRVRHAGEETTYGRRQQGASDVVLHRSASGRLDHQRRGALLSECPPGPDSFLEAAGLIPFGSLSEYYPHAREELADIMVANPLLMRLRLAILLKGLPGDQESWLRLCLIHGIPTPFGEQLLNPGLPQRAVTAEDLQFWFNPTVSALRRMPESLHQEGISLLDVHRLATPMRPTEAGIRLMGVWIESRPRKMQPDALALLRFMLPSLVYAYRSIIGVKRYLQMSDQRFKVLVTQAQQKAALDFSEDAQAADIVELPPSWY